MQDEQGFITTIRLLDSSPDDGEGHAHEQSFVTEHEPDIDGINRYARTAGWPVEIRVARAPLLGGDGGTEIAQWITDQNRIETRNDPIVARMNGLERNFNSLAKGQRRIEEMLAQMIGKPATRAAAPTPPAAMQATPDEASEGFDVPRPTHRRDAPMRTPEMNANPDHRSNSMGLVGPAATSQVFSFEGGVDDEGLPKRVPMSRVGETLHKGS